FTEKFRGLAGRAAAMHGNDVNERSLDVLRHPQRVTADVDMCAVIEPGPEVAADFTHAMLDVDFLVAVARPGERKAREQPGGTHRHQFVFVEEVEVAPLMSEEQPIPSGRLGRLALMQKGAKRRDAGTGPDHDDRLREVRRQRKMLGLLNIDPDLVAGRDAAAEERRADAEPHALVDLVTHGIDGERETGGIGFWRGGDRIEAGLQRIERLDEGLGIGPYAGKFVE